MLLQAYIVSPRAGVVRKLKFQVFQVLKLKNGFVSCIYITSLIEIVRSLPFSCFSPAVLDIL